MEGRDLGRNFFSQDGAVFILVWLIAKKLLRILKETYAANKY
jgi:hypothetical protein